MTLRRSASGFISSRSATKAVTSASSMVVTETFARWLSASFSAVLRRMPMKGTRSSAAAEADAGAAAAWPLPIAAERTSSSVTRPPGPLPRSRAKSTLRVEASLRTAGVARTAAEGAAAPLDEPWTLAGAAWGAGAARAAGAFEGPAPASSKMTRVPWTCTLSPGFAASFKIFPDLGLGISTSALSVRMLQRF